MSSPRKKKILLISLFLPRRNATHAGSRHVHDILSHLAELHEVHLVTRVEEEERNAIEEVAPYCRKIHPFFYRAGNSRKGFDLDKARRFADYLRFGRFADRVSRESEFDLVQAEWVGAALLVKRRDVPLVLDAHDVMSKVAARAKERARGLGRLTRWLTYRGTRLIEGWIMSRCDMVLTVSDFDRNLLAVTHPHVRARTVPIVATGADAIGTYTRHPHTILFLASFRYRRVNTEAALHFYRYIFPLVRREMPESQYIIAGFGPPPELTELAEKDGKVMVVGFVEDLQRTYGEAAVFVAPILVGGGLIVKIIEAMAAGTPVVTTAFGNEGVGALPGHDLLVANTAEEFAAAVVSLLRNPREAARIGENGRIFVGHRYSHEAVFAALDAAHRELGVV